MMDRVYPKNFTESELLHSNAAVRLNIPNHTNDEFVEINLLRTAEFLQAIRNALSTKFGKEMPIKILSGYRCPEVNRAVGGAKSSAHMRGLAADIVVEGMSNFDLANFIAQRFPIFDQIILEFATDDDSGWVHVGLSEGHARNSLLTAKKVRGKTVYTSGIIR